MFCHSVLKRWDTPIAGATSVEIESIEADGYLSITLRAFVYERVLLICFSFLNYHWYQIKRFAPSYDTMLGRTQIHASSTEDESSTSILNLNLFQIATAGSNDCLLTSIPFSSSHFVIIEDRSEIEVISVEQPAIILIGKEPLKKLAHN